MTLRISLFVQVLDALFAKPENQGFLQHLLGDEARERFKAAGQDVCETVLKVPGRASTEEGGGGTPRRRPRLAGPAHSVCLRLMLACGGVTRCPSAVEQLGSNL